MKYILRVISLYLLLIHIRVAFQIMKLDSNIKTIIKKIYLKPSNSNLILNIVMNVSEAGF